MEERPEKAMDMRSPGIRTAGTIPIMKCSVKEGPKARIAIE